MFELARWAQKISSYVKSGQMKAQYTYAEFKQKVAQIPPQTNFSRLAKYAAAEQKASKGQQSGDSIASSAGLKIGALAKENLSEVPCLSSAKKQKTVAKDDDIVDDDEYAGWSKNDLVQEAEVWVSGKQASALILWHV